MEVQQRSWTVALLFLRTTDDKDRHEIKIHKFRCKTEVKIQEIFNLSHLENNSWKAMRSSVKIPSASLWGLRNLSDCFQFDPSYFSFLLDTSVNKLLQHSYTSSLQNWITHTQKKGKESIVHRSGIKRKEIIAMSKQNWRLSLPASPGQLQHSVQQWRRSHQWIRNSATTEDKGMKPIVNRHHVKPPPRMKDAAMENHLAL